MLSKNPWGCPWHTSSGKITSECQYATGLSKRVTHWCSKAHFWELQGTLFCSSGPPPRTMLFRVVSSHLAGCGSSLCRLHAKKKHFNSMVSTFLCLGGAKETKTSQLGHPGLPKDTKDAQSESPGHQKCIPKATLGLYGVPREPPDVSKALP